MVTRESARALTEDAYLKARATGTFNARIGYRWEGGWKFQIDAFNILDSRSDQITYGYGSLIRAVPVYGPVSRPSGWWRPALGRAAQQA